MSLSVLLTPASGPFLLAAATPNASASSIAQMVMNFLPFAQMVQTVNNVMPIFNLIALFLIIVATVQEIPKHQGDGIFTVFLRGIVLIALISIVTPLMSQTELLTQGIVKSIASSTNPPETWIINVAGGDPQTSVLYDFSQPFNEIAQFLPASQGSLIGDIGSSVAHSVSPTDWVNYIPGVATFKALEAAYGGAAKWGISDLMTGVIGAVTALTIFIMEVMLVVQKAILIFSRLFMPPFIGLLSWQGPTRFLGINYIQAVLGTMAWPIGWAVGNIGTMAGLQNIGALIKDLDSNTTNIGPLILIFINLFLLESWMVLVTVMGPMLIQKVVTAGGHFGGAMVGALAGKALGAPAAALGAAGTAGGAAIGAAVGGPAGMVTGAQMGGGLGNSIGSSLTSGLTSAVSGATAEGGGGGGGGTASQAASAMYMAQMGRQSNYGQTP